jgi:hypothetical protein
MTVTPPKNLTTASLSMLNMVKFGLLDEIANAPDRKVSDLKGQLEMVMDEIRLRHRRGEHR